METALLIFLILALFLLVLQKNILWFVIGLMVGLMVWIRPDAVSLLGPVMMIGVFRPVNTRDKTFAFLKLAAGVMILLLPFLIFNHVTSGNWMPNTFYAKQAEYAILLNLPLAARLGPVFLQPVIGVGVLWLPGLVWLTWRAIKNREWHILAWTVWFLGYLSIYAFWLPVTYQHGRYQMPGMPVYFVLAISGCIQIIICYWRRKKWSIALKTWSFSIPILVLVFLIIGAFTYAGDVDIIQSEMVQTALWVSQNTPVDSIIAAHDIGALGYWGNRKIIDLAGLVTPEIIPMIRNEQSLSLYLDRKGADYLMVFPGWYGTLTKGKKILFQVNSPRTESDEQNNMSVYKWK